MTEMARLAARLHPLPEGDCLIGLSGGADSVALLYLLLPLREAGRIRLGAVHVNHGLRGAESDADEAFVRGLCEGLRVPLRTERPDLGGRSDENTARQARYAAFARAMRETGAGTLVLAHQRDDQAETFLLRLLRGAGPEGLAAMRAREERDGYLLLRPMLDISGAELRSALREAGLPWREDSSNREDRYLRNRIRQDLLPRMEEMAPGAGARIARAAELIGRDGDTLAAEAEQFLRERLGPEGLETDALRELPDALRVRTLRMWWRREGPRLDERALSYEQTARLAGLAEAPRGTIINLPGGWRARREKRTLRLMTPGDRTRNNRPARRSGRAEPAPGTENPRREGNEENPKEILTGIPAGQRKEEQHD